MLNISFNKLKYLNSIDKYFGIKTKNDYDNKVNELFYEGSLNKLDKVELININKKGLSLLDFDMDYKMSNEDM